MMKQFERLPQEITAMGLVPRSSEQSFALDLLLDPKVELVTIIGLAGSGKSLCALAAGLHEVMETKQYKKLLLLKPIVAMDNSNQLGFLKGSMEEKLAPWMASYTDNIEVLMSGDHKVEIPKTKGKKGAAVKSDSYDEKAAGKVPAYQELIAHGFIEIGSLEHMRGRSLPNIFVICDEIQSMTPKSIKSLITRLGEGSKLVLLGDIFQIDNPYLSAENNAIVHVTDKFKSTDISGHLTLKKSERSKLAALAAELL